MSTAFFSPMTLTTIDHMMPICYITFIYTLNAKDVDQGIEILRGAINRLVEDCPVLAANVGRASAAEDNRKNVLEIQPSSKETLVQYPLLQVSRHQAQSTIGHSPKDHLSDERSFFALHPSIARHFPCPIIRWRATVVSDGILVAVTFHHSVLDAGGFYTVQDALARICRNISEPNPDPNLRNALHEGRTRLNAIRLRGDPMKSRHREHELVGRMADFDLPPPLVSERITLQSQKIQYLRRWCSTSYTANTHAKQPSEDLTSNDVISGLLWQCITAAQWQKMATCDHSESSLVLISDVRHKLRPGVPASYLGNCIVQKLVKMKAELPPADLQSGKEALLQELQLYARSVSKASKKVTDNFVKTLMLQKYEARNWSPRFMQGDVTSTSLRRMPIYNLDFGSVLGRVAGFDVVDDRIDGTVCILPACSTSNSNHWELRITLAADVLKQVRRHPLLLWAMEGSAVEPRL
ncbi:hypothetical protein POX_e07330 [Penicillium oxalicum]|uniref:hypothetical protein n=1 Tax=Penicillium oxalicum TaxID=69781 RepID=UPI0020B87153|nr:hypothetical protein POX_e07330 [Penicillium oxalicum]KAI2789300.1 hypothetical protein POX_e07330 [Penicillium oxalicum]